MPRTFLRLNITHRSGNKNLRDFCKLIIKSREFHNTLNLLGGPMSAERRWQREQLSLFKIGDDKNSLLLFCLLCMYFIYFQMLSNIFSSELCLEGQQGRNYFFHFADEETKTQIKSFAQDVTEEKLRNYFLLCINQDSGRAFSKGLSQMSNKRW